MRGGGARRRVGRGRGVEGVWRSERAGVERGRGVGCGRGGMTTCGRHYVVVLDPLRGFAGGTTRANEFGIA